MAVDVDTSRQYNDDRRAPCFASEDQALECLAEVLIEAYFAQKNYEHTNH